MEHEFGKWVWFILAAILLVGELVNPGVFLIWLAAAAGLTGLVHLAYPTGWALEALIFAGLAFALVAASWRFVSKAWNPKSDQPFLNQRQHGMVGRTFALHQAIINGHGKIKFEDTIWDADGPDLPAGTRVKVTGVDGLRLLVTAA